MSSVFADMNSRRRTIHAVAFPFVASFSLALHVAGSPNKLDITDYTETPFRPNVASSDDSTFEGRVHSFNLNGKPRQLSEIRSSTGELLYFGIASDFYAHHNGEVFGFMAWTGNSLGVLPSLHKEHKTGPAGRPYDPILCGSWDEFVEKAEKVGYFFPKSHFFQVH